MTTSTPPDGNDAGRAPNGGTTSDATTPGAAGPAAAGPAAAPPPRLDEPGAFRPGEELDRAALERWIRGVTGDRHGALEIAQFGKGHSNLTYFVRLGDREWVLRRPPFGTHVATAHDMGREFRVLSRLHELYPPAPRAEHFCDDTAILGAPFFLMERVRGVIIRKDVPRGVTLDEDTARRLCASFVEHFARIHEVNLAAIGLEDLGNPVGYIGRQVDGWTRRYHGSQTDDIADVTAVTSWLAANTPDDDRGCLIHNDFKLDNIVLDPGDVTRIIGVLDWEMTTVGHPLMDVGTTLAYWVQADDPPEMQMLRFMPTNLPGMLTRRELVDAYGERTGTNIGNIRFHEVYGLFKLSVIAQQIYYRFKAGKTSDPRFAMMIEAVRMLNRVAVSRIEAPAP